MSIGSGQERIDLAMARIARATRRHRAAHDEAGQRHDRTTNRLREAIAAIDEMIAQERVD